MSTVTPNFNWPVPTSTDLVRDGATAIEALGDSIDASLVDLKGGTTGQVLSKTSNTDMDFTWVAQDDSNAIQNTIVDAKGDLIAASAADTPARLAVGANGETLVADSSTSTGLRWQNPKSVNYILNSNFNIWQRGTSFALASGTITYTADRWSALRGATGATITRQTTSDTTNLPNIKYAVRIQRDSGNSSTNNIALGQSFENDSSTPLIGKTVVYSFWARKGADASTAGMASSLISGTGTNQNELAGFTGGATVASTSPNLTTDWVRYSATGTVSSSATQIAIRFTKTSTGTAGANDWIEITGVQVEIGSVPTFFQTATGTIQGELDACCYYYERLVSDATYTAFGAGFYTTGSRLFVNVPYQRKRVAPLLAFSNVAGWWGSGSLGAATIATSYIGKTSAGLDVSVSGGSTSTGFGGILSSNNNTAGYIELNSEL